MWNFRSIFILRNFDASVLIEINWFLYQLYHFFDFFDFFWFFHDFFQIFSVREIFYQNRGIFGFFSFYRWIPLYRRVNHVNHQRNREKECHENGGAQKLWVNESRVPVFLLFDVFVAELLHFSGGSAFRVFFRFSFFWFFLFYGIHDWNCVRIFGFWRLIFPVLSQDLIYEQISTHKSQVLARNCEKNVKNT